MSAQTPTALRTLDISVRESRLVVERILLTLGIPSGFTSAVRDVILTSQSLGMAGFCGLTDPARLAALHAGAKQLAGLSVQEQPRGIHIAANGLHAWLALPTWVDLLVAHARTHGSCEGRIDDVLEPQELASVAPLAERYGVAVTCHLDDRGAHIRARAAPAPIVMPTNPCLARSLREGFAIAESDWWPLYEASKKALSPDSVTSRRHAGPTIVQDDGTVLGRPPADDDTDLALLRRAP